MGPVLIESNVPYKAFVQEVRELPAGYLPYEEFVKGYSLGGASTEQSHESTKNLSQVMQADPVKGLQLLHGVDQAVPSGFEQFIPSIEELAPIIAARIKKGGRVFLVGSGSSGRAAVDIAAKCNQLFPSEKERVRGVIAGGDSAMVRAKEGFEDSEVDGEKCLEPFHLNENDTVILISASGSASFNVGCGHYAANKGAQVLYFYNSKEVPSRTKQLFERQNNPVRPLERDIGAQAIRGSTRLSVWSLAEACLGALLHCSLLHCEEKEAQAKQYPHDLLKNLKAGNDLLAGHLETIAKFVMKEKEVFLSPEANFRRAHDETDEGYVTMIVEPETLRDPLIDSVEGPPTFTLEPDRRESELHQRRGEYKTYLAGKGDNRAAWRKLLGREITPADLADTDQFLLAMEAPGINSYANRPVGKGNFVIGVVKQAESPDSLDAMVKLLQEAASQGAETALIVLSKGQLSPPPGAPPLTLLLENIPSDPFGIVETILLKQTLNLISNGAMIQSGKVLGNRMIDVRASNRKLIDRVYRLIKEIWEEFQRPMMLSDEELYHYIIHVCELKKAFANKGHYTPSVVKIVLALLYLEKEPVADQFQEVLDFIAKGDEWLNFLANEDQPYTFCIDGGGSKTLLEIVDAKGRIIPFTKDGEQFQSIIAGPSNINTVKQEGVRAVLHDLFNNLKIGAKEHPFAELAAKSRVVAGMAGVSIPENSAAVAALFKELGFQKLQLFTDAALAQQLLKGHGIVLISGTGSVCFAEKKGTKRRVGGLGPILGDEGSGYQIGRQAIKAALEEEFEYGPPTSLSAPLKAFFKVDELKTLLPQITSLEIPAATIASIAPLVFEKAAEKDPVAAAIISGAAKELRKLVATAMEASKLKKCELHLWGGVFKGPFANMIIDELEMDKEIKIINRSHENAVRVFARTFRFYEDKL